MSNPRVADSEILERFAGIVANSLRIEPERVTADAYLSDLGAESLDLLEITMEVEDEFGIIMPQKDILQVGQEVVGPDVLVRDGLITEDGVRFLRSRLPAVDQRGARRGHASRRRQPHFRARRHLGARDPGVARSRAHRLPVVRRCALEGTRGAAAMPGVRDRSRSSRWRRSESPLGGTVPPARAGTHIRRGHASPLTGVGGPRRHEGVPVASSTSGSNSMTAASVGSVASRGDRSGAGVGQSIASRGRSR